MKLIKKLSALILSLVLAMTAMVIPVTAAEADKKDTTSTVTFEPDTSGPGGASLYLDHVPTLDFGTHPVSPDDEAYPATALSDKLLCVVDGRGAGTGWSVIAKIDRPFTGQTSSTRLDGSRIKITGGTITYGAVAQTPPPAPTQPGSIILNNSGEPTAILTAAAGHGKGIWDNNLDVVNLEVPGGSALAETYMATILWTLNDVPE